MQLYHLDGTWMNGNEHVKLAETTYLGLDLELGE